MALFAIWHDDAVGPDKPPTLLHRRLREEAHLVPEYSVEDVIETTRGRWHIAAFACASHFHSAAAQVWLDPARGACIIHGLIWRSGNGRPLDAAAVAALLDRPDARLPDDVLGEYAIARLLPCGTLLAFSDPAGLHQIFHHEHRPIVASRARFVAELAGEPIRETPLWTIAIGYRAGLATAWAGVTQVPQARMLVARPDAEATFRDLADPIRMARARERGLTAGADLLERGIDDARAVIRLAAGDGMLTMPITGGKDSRAILALALAEGLRDRLSLFTRGPARHPDVIVGRMLAEAAGVPHRHELPLGSGDTDWPVERFVRTMAAIAFQTDGNMGGWDLAVGKMPGTATHVTGHLGDLLKAITKRMPADPADPVALLRCQAPFDPMGILRPAPRERLVDEFAARIAGWLADGALPHDLPEISYYRDRTPNWLGGMRGVKSFEQQPLLPFGVPSLQQLAFRMAPEERRIGAVHHAIVRDFAPALLPIPFAHQRWDDSLGGPWPAAMLAPADMPFFGSWQYSINRNPAIRAFLAALFEATADLALWEDVDRAVVLDRLHNRRFDYFDGISLLGLTVSVLHASGMTMDAKIGAPWPETPDALAALIPAASPRVIGHVDGVTGAAADANGQGEVRIDGWAQAPDWPGASVAVEARVDGRVVASAAAERPRADLAAAGIGDGRYGFTIALDAAALAGIDVLVIDGLDGTETIVGGRIALRGQP